MSSDNGIYLLETKTTEGGKEYRVVYTQGIDNIYGPFNDSLSDYEHRPEMIKLIFDQAPVFLNESDAWDHAFELESNYPYLEHGLGAIRTFNRFTYEELTENAKTKGHSQSTA